MKYKKDWTKNDRERVQKKIVQMFRSRPYHATYSEGMAIIYKRSYSYLSNFLGLAYTSSGAYLGLWVCNAECYLDLEKKYRLIGFAISTSEAVTSIWWDEDENELNILI